MAPSRESDIPLDLQSNRATKPDPRIERRVPPLASCPQASELPELSGNYLGNFTVWRLPQFIGGKVMLMSPDWQAWFAPTAVSLILAGGGMCLVYRQLSWLELNLFLLDAVLAFIFSFLCACTDPGIYPRLAEGQIDRLQGANGPVCRVCKIHRPPRSSHCWTCGVCILEHDHHCGIVGGCIGLRTLRYFVGYLVCISSCCVIMFLFVLRSIFKLGGSLGSFPTKNSLRQRSHNSSGDFGFALHLIELMAVGNIALVVGIMALYYVGLLMTDTTRREAQGKRFREGTVGGRSTCFCVRWMSNFWRSLHPPRSILTRYPLPSEVESPTASAYV